jgi:hypothetical protein
MTWSLCRKHTDLIRPEYGSKVRAFPSFPIRVFGEACLEAIVMPPVELDERTL